jgi:hypothetical protein
MSDESAEIAAGTATETASLRKLNPSKLTPGLEIPAPVQTEDGRIVVDGGKALEETDIKLLSVYASQGLFGGEDWTEEFFATGEEDAAQPAASPVHTEGEPESETEAQPEAETEAQPQADAQAGEAPG